MDYDVLFWGSGHSCNHGGIALAMAGKKVAFVEMNKMGGTCTNFGCDAKIMLDGPFEFLDGLKRYEGLCVDRFWASLTHRLSTRWCPTSYLHYRVSDRSE